MIEFKEKLGFLGGKGGALVPSPQAAFPNGAGAGPMGAIGVGPTSSGALGVGKRFCAKFGFDNKTLQKFVHNFPDNQLGRTEIDDKKSRGQKVAATCTFRTRAPIVFQLFKAFQNETATSRDECANKCNSAASCNAAHFNPNESTANCQLATVDETQWGCSVDGTEIEENRVVILFCIQC